MVDGEPATEGIELWFRDPIECVQGLIGNPTFREHVSYVPQKVFTNRTGTTRIYDEAWTGDWWWSMQVRGGLLVFACDVDIINRTSCLQVLLLCC